MKNVHQGDLGDVHEGIEDRPYRPLPGEGVFSRKGLLFGAFRTFTATSLHCRLSILLGIVPGSATEQIQPILEVVNLQFSVAFVSGLCSSTTRFTGLNYGALSDLNMLLLRHELLFWRLQVG